MASHLKNLSDFSHTTIPNGNTYKIAIVVAEWNAKITGALYAGALNTLLKHGVNEENIITAAVPGSFELTAAAEILLTRQSNLDAVICLGCVIQGDTKHFDFICDAVANGIVQALELLGDKATKPIVVRLDGNNVLEGRAILNAANHPLVEQAETMDGAASRAAELAAK